VRIVIITQARMLSRRLPGKVLRHVVGKPLLQWHVERLQQVSGISEVVVATSDRDADDPIAEACAGWGVACFRGPELDVLKRYELAAEGHAADVVVRVTSDCPLIDPQEVRRVIDRYLESGTDYCSNTIERTFPRGLDTEVFSRAVLKIAHDSALDQAEREHVTPFIWGSPERFSITSVTADEDHSDHRWCVDTEDDLRLIEALLSDLDGRGMASTFSWLDVLEVFSRRPDLQIINRHTRQKKIR